MNQEQSISNRVLAWIKCLQSGILNQEHIRVLLTYAVEGGKASCKELSNKYGENANYYNNPSINIRVQDFDFSLGKAIFDDGLDASGTVHHINQDLKEALQILKYPEIPLYPVKIMGLKLIRKENTSELEIINTIEVEHLLPLSELEPLRLSDKETLTGFTKGDFLELCINEQTTLFVQLLENILSDKQNVPISVISKQTKGVMTRPVLRSTGKLAKDMLPLIKRKYALSLADLRKMKSEVMNSESATVLPVISPIIVPEKSDYTKNDFLSEVYMSSEQLDELLQLIKKKKNVILQGAPGVGKTFSAKRIAYVILGGKKDENIEFIQFHQSYSYEDFIMGYKPTEEGFELRKGSFYRFCQKAKERPDQDFFFIIDEINRGNLSKIFGELLYLIENDYRGVEIRTAYSDELFSVPDNVYIIGMMNTADRSLALIDYALRRRFSFFEMEPGFKSAGFSLYQNAIGSDLFNSLISTIMELNIAIAEDGTLGKGFCIGHSYFCNLQDASVSRLRSIIKYEILPMLKEYWFDNNEKVEYWSKRLLGAVDDRG